MTWEALEDNTQNCIRCQLAEARQNVVLGTGSRQATIMFVGEGPGYQEDLRGLPFVGPAGKLLDKMLAAIQLDRKTVYITNIVKCRPPDNRDPSTTEQEACMPFLRAQFLLIRPQIIVCLGRIAAQALLEKDFLITKQRGIWHERKNTWFIATYHPSALLRDDTKKRPAWDDFKKIRQKYCELRGTSL